MSGKVLWLKLRHPQRRRHRPGQAAWQRPQELEEGLGLFLYFFFLQVPGLGVPAMRTYVLLFCSSQREKVDVTHTHTPGTTRVLITVLIVCEPQHIPLQCLKSHLFWYLIVGMVPAAEPGCW